MSTPPIADQDTPTPTPTLTQGLVLLDDSRRPEATTWLFERPLEIVRADTPEAVEPALARIVQGLSLGLHAAGFFSYELGYALEPRLRPLLPTARRLPLLWMGLYSEPRQVTSAAVEDWLTATAPGAPALDAVTPDWDEASYLERFERVQRYLWAGDLYQLNLTFKARFALDGSPLALYRMLRSRQRVAYGGLLDTGEMTILSASPELFVEGREGMLWTRPMKGTAPRADTPAEDAKVREQLANDVKTRAENLMILDLMRNDFGRIAALGSVAVTDCFTVETYETLHQMTSGVRARVRDGVGLVELLRALFPPGSVTGAPKIHAMELIRELEPEPRGVYCGAIGHLAPDGGMRLNVAIRTVVLDRAGRGEIGTGSGLVADSDGSSEYAECLLKLRFLTEPPCVPSP